MSSVQNLSVISLDVQPPRRRSGTRRFLRRFAKNKAAVVSAVFILILIVLAIFAPWVTHYKYDAVDFASITAEPSPAHPLGTDALGRDMLSRLIYGARVSLMVSFIAQMVIIAVGVPIGLISGFYGGWIDMVIQRVIDVLYAFPTLLFIIIIMTYLQGTLDKSKTPLAIGLSGVNDATGGLLGVLIALGLVFWLTISRIVRGEVLSVKEKEYITAGRALGATSGHLMTQHILPNILAPVLVAIAFGIPNVIMLEAGLSYLGLGTKPPVPSWGLMIAEGVKGFRSFPHLLISPGLMLAVTLLSFNFLGDGVREALDPALRNE